MTNSELVEEVKKLESKIAALKGASIYGMKVPDSVVSPVVSASKIVAELVIREVERSVRESRG